MMSGSLLYSDIAIIPEPTSFKAVAGCFVFNGSTPLVADEASMTAALAFADSVRPALGRQPLITGTAADGVASIVFRLDTALVDCGSEGYCLDVTSQGVEIVSPSQAGLFYGVQTLRQLLPAVFFANKPLAEKEWSIPCVSIFDKPRYQWRGLMLDTGHDFQCLSNIFRFIDLMALHKFNVFHWHISDLGTFPLEIDGYPELQNPAHLGKRLRGNPPRPVKQGFYTQAEARAVVEYAAARYIKVVPEIDVPGHSQPVLLAYPEFDCPTPMYQWQDFERWEYCLANPKAMAFIEEVLQQILAIFPSEYVHIGGDECPATHWDGCPMCQAKVAELKLDGVEGLRKHFLAHVETFLNSRGRRMIGWDDIFQSGVKKESAVMIWRPDLELAVPAATAGHNLVMAPHSHLYFDYSEARTPLDKVYSYEPHPEGLAEEMSDLVLGAQGQLWSDNHPTTAEIDRLLYPRSCALAEVVWSAKEQRNWESFSRRLQRHGERLAKLGIVW